MRNIGGGVYPANEISHEELTRMLEGADCFISVPPAIATQLLSGGAVPREFYLRSVYGGVLLLGFLLVFGFSLWSYLSWLGLLLLIPASFVWFLLVRRFGLSLSPNEYCAMSAYKYPQFWELLQETGMVRVYVKDPAGSLGRRVQRYKV